LNRYRGRFAPSPTGPLHQGSLVAALASYAEARSQGGEWLVRMEDIDIPRTVPGAAEGILRCLKACALKWDGEVVFQTTRFAAYQEALDRLRARGFAYPCACSRKDARGDGVYPGTCRDGIAAGRQARLVRLRVPDEDAAAIPTGDFPLFRADGIWAYQLAVVVDDAWQEITHVVRGADLADSTPRQVLLQRLLGLAPVTYAHIPVVLGDDGQKLSKQTKAPPVDVSNPGPAMAAALRFLRQRVPEGMERWQPREIAAHAIRHWNLAAALH
jgi:glutamyl-Q tRNA(Asp) synthetase